MNIEDVDFSGKVVLEVGSGRGTTTRKLVDLLSGTTSAKLIVSDVSDMFFQQLQDEFSATDVDLEYICTEAHVLQGIQNYSTDYIVCNYTLCAVNVQTAWLPLTLQRFWEVLKDGGQLFVEEEFPIGKEDSGKQEIWAEKWRILKAATILAGKFPYNEVAPEGLENLCRMIGFRNVSWVADRERITDTNVLSFFQKRLNMLLTELPCETIRAGFLEMATMLHDKLIEEGSMEIPYYRLLAKKGGG